MPRTRWVPLLDVPSPLPAPSPPKQGCTQLRGTEYRLPTADLSGAQSAAGTVESMPAINGAEHPWKSVPRPSRSTKRASASKPKPPVTAGTPHCWGWLGLDAIAILVLLEGLSIGIHWIFTSTENWHLDVSNHPDSKPALQVTYSRLQAY